MQKQKSETGRWILTRIRNFIPHLLVLVIVVVAISYIGVQFSLVSKRLIDIATMQEDGNLKLAVIKMVVLLVLQLLLQIIYIRIHVSVSGKLAMKLRSELFYKLLSKDYSDVSKIHSGEVLNRLVSDVSLLSEKTTEIIPNVFALLSTIILKYELQFFEEQLVALL